ACFRAGALASGAEVEIRSVGPDYSDMFTNRPLAECYRANLERLDRKVRDMQDVPGAFAGSTDMGNVSKLVPSIQALIAVSPPTVAVHSPEFATWAGSENGDRAVVDGAKGLAMTAVDILGDAALLDDVKDAFARDIAS